MKEGSKSSRMSTFVGTGSGRCTSGRNNVTNPSAETKAGVKGRVLEWKQTIAVVF